MLQCEHGVAWEGDDRQGNGVCRGDPAPMEDVWHHTDRVTTAHPLGDWAYGWEQVWASWQELSLTARNST